MKTKIIDINDNYYVKINYNDKSSLYMLKDKKEDKTICESFNGEDKVLQEVRNIMSSVKLERMKEEFKDALEQDIFDNYTTEDVLDLVVRCLDLAIKDMNSVYSEELEESLRDLGKALEIVSKVRKRDVICTL